MPVTRHSALSVRDDKVQRLRAVLKEKAQSLQVTKAAPSDAGFLRDASLDRSIEPCGPAHPVSSTSAILLTGATGFLGAHLLHDLCRLTKATVYCLVRAHTHFEARRRLEQNLAQYTDFTLSPERVIPVLGDLAKPRLGLSAKCFEELAVEIDAIFHNGANLNHLASYERLRAANVVSTVDLLRLAGSRKPKWMYYVSSMIAASDRDHEGYLLEQLPARDPFEISGGYAQSKWICEHLFGQARLRGFGVTVFRPGIIGGRRDSGAWAVAHDHLLLLLKSCQQLGCASASSLTVDLSPVDYVSEAMVRLSMADYRQPVVHLSNPNPLTWTTIVEWMNQLGYPMEVVPFEVWQKRLAQIDDNNALFPLLPVYLAQPVVAERQQLISKLSKVSRAVTTPMLKSLGLDYPVIDRNLWQKYIHFCCNCGFFPTPIRELKV
jgi:thioester reductase-like protein